MFSPHTRLEPAPGLWLDARRAVFLAETRTLAVADLHLGYAWTHRASGNLLPVGAPEDTVDRLKQLIADYAPEELILAGDIVHGFAPTGPVREELRRLVKETGTQTRLRLIAGNHDGWLPEFLDEAGCNHPVETEIAAGRHLFLHGHAADDRQANARLQAARQRHGRVIFGHEHPAMVLSGGVATSARCPCFLISDDAVVLPAFSAWSSGTDVRGGVFLSPYSRAAHFDRAVVIVAGKLLPVPL